MGPERETLGQHTGEVAGAAVDVECLAAFVASEVVVVSFAGEFIAWGLAGEFDGDNFATLLKGADCAINCCNANTWNKFRSHFQDILWAQWIGVFLEEGSDGVSLGCASFHGAS